MIDSKVLNTYQIFNNQYKLLVLAYQICNFIRHDYTYNGHKIKRKTMFSTLKSSMFIDYRLDVCRNRAGN